MEGSRTSLYLSMNLSVKLSTTREIIVITGEKGKCYQALSNKERGDGFDTDLQVEPRRPISECAHA
jgi:hypothetical protein